MPKKREPAPTKAQTCPKCGVETKVSLRNGHLYPHQAPGRPGPCPMSGEIVLDASALEGRYECACGTWARVNRKGLLYEHRMSDEDEVCPLSGEPIQVAADQPSRLAIRGHLRMVPPAPNGGWEKHVGSGSSSSVYAILAGLPGHGRRR